MKTLTTNRIIGLVVSLLVLFALVFFISRAWKVGQN